MRVDERGYPGTPCRPCPSLGHRHLEVRGGEWIQGGQQEWSRPGQRSAWTAALNHIPCPAPKGRLQVSKVIISP